MSNDLNVLTELNSTQFMQDYWQKRPCVIKRFINDFQDPIDEHDLAGLAQEEGVDSRIVSKITGQNVSKDAANADAHGWDVHQGPFDDYSQVCVGAWSLLVQGVDKYIPEVDQLTQAVSFIPYWRLDDVMVSFSNQHAGVGAHIDEYDVFIVQGKGSRRWQVGLPSEREHKTIMPHPLLKQIEGFVPLIDEVLEPGDAVYIPPKHPHNGVALQDCINYSIGFRAPTDVELITALLDEDDLSKLQTRYTDADLSSIRRVDSPSGQVTQSELTRLKAFITERLTSTELDTILLKSLSRQLLPSVDESPEYTMQDIEDFCDQALAVERMPGVRPLYLEPLNTDVFSFYIDGHSFEVEIALTGLVQNLISESQTKTNQTFDNTKTKLEWQCLLLKLINLGFWQPIFD